MEVWKKINFIFSNKEKVEIVIIIFALLISAFLEMVGVAAILPLVNILVTPEKIQNGVIKELYNFLSCSSEKQFFVYCMLILVLVYILKNLFLYIVYKVQYNFIFLGQKNLAIKLMDCYMYQPYNFYLNTNTAEIQRSSNADVTRFFQAILLFLQLMTDVLLCIIMGLFLLITDWVMTISIMVGLVICLCICTYSYKKKLEILGEDARNIGSELFKWVSQAFGGIKEIRILGKEQYFIDKYAEAYSKYAEISRCSSLISITPKLIIESISILMLVAAIVIRLVLGTNMVEFIPQLATIAIAAFKMLPSFNRMTSQMNQITYLKSSIDSVYKDLKEGVRLEHNRINDGDNIVLRLQDSLQLKNISFRYEREGSNILDNLSMDIKAKSSVAIIGMSGGGKTTLIDIILGLLEYNSGEILVDNKSIKNTLREWNKCIGYIPQNIYLIDDTIKNNIAFGIDESEINNSRINEVLRITQLHSFIENLPEGIETIVGEMGVRISGGQRQRIGIARALYNDPDILILDEATSALDNETEEAIMKAINSLKGIKTLIIIAHRLETIKQCDMVYKIEDGKAVLQY